MAPKKRAASPGPKAKAKADAKAKPKAKAETESKPPEPEGLEKVFGKTADDLFQVYSVEVEIEDSTDKEFVVKLAGFAQFIKDTNAKFDSPFDDEPPIKQMWKDIGGFSSKQVKKDAFLNFLPNVFTAFTDKRVEQNEKAAAKATAEAAKKEEEAAMFAGDGIWAIKLPALLTAIDKAFEKRKTPLILDCTEGHRSEAFFLHSGAHIIECKKMIMDKAKGGNVTDILEEVRERFFAGNCFKYGQTVVFRFANTAIDLKVFSDESFPSLSLLDASEVAKVLGPENASAFEGSPFCAMCKRSEDKQEHTLMGVNDKFRVVAVSHFEDDSYEEYLKANVPLEKMQPIRVLVD